MSLKPSLRSALSIAASTGISAACGGQALDPSEEVAGFREVPDVGTRTLPPVPPNEPVHRCNVSYPGPTVENATAQPLRWAIAGVDDSDWRTPGLDAQETRCIERALDSCNEVALTTGATVAAADATFRQCLGERAKACSADDVDTYVGTLDASKRTRAGYSVHGYGASLLAWTREVAPPAPPTLTAFERTMFDLGQVEASYECKTREGEARRTEFVYTINPNSEVALRTEHPFEPGALHQFVDGSRPTAAAGNEWTPHEDNVWRLAPRPNERVR